MYMRRGAGVTQNANMDLPDACWHDAWTMLRGEQLGATFDQPAQGRGTCKVGSGWDRWWWTDAAQGAALQPHS